MVNLYLRVFSFSLNNRGFEILLRSQSLKSPFSGSWSVTTIRFGQPITNIRHFSNAQAIAAASLSIGAYLRLASMQNLLPANIRRQPSGQQTGALSVMHMQYFVVVGSPHEGVMCYCYSTYANDIAHLANAPTQAESLLHCLE